jgi:hypothetical protein
MRIGCEDEVRQYRGRVGRLRAAGLLGFTLLVARLSYLQVWHGEELHRFSDRNRLKKETL